MAEISSKVNIFRGVLIFYCITTYHRYSGQLSTYIKHYPPLVLMFALLLRSSCLALGFSLWCQIQAKSKPLQVYKGKNKPFGQVPALEDGDLKLFESRAITQYIAHEHKNSGTALICGDGKTLALIAVWIEVEAHKFDPVASKLAWELVYKKMFGMETDPSAVEEHKASLSTVLDIYEARLSKSKYLACDCFTLADLHHLPVLHMLMGTPVADTLFRSRPCVSKWADDILGRPAWAKVVAAMQPTT